MSPMMNHVKQHHTCYYRKAMYTSDIVIEYKAATVQTNTGSRLLQIAFSDVHACRSGADRNHVALPNSGAK
jgi:hypothetical protein